MDKKTKHQIDTASAILKAAGAREVYVFGSASRDMMRINSDIDIAVSGLPPSIYFRILGQIANATERSIDVIDLDEDTPFTRYLKEMGELQRVDEIAEAD